MTLEEILEESKEIGLTSLSDLARESLRNPILFHKYNREYATARKKLKAMEREKKKIIRELFLYYTGKADNSIVKRKGVIDFKIMKSDISVFIDSDPEMVEVQSLLDDAAVKVETIENILLAIKQRGWDIKNAVEFQKFISGAN